MTEIIKSHIAVIYNASIEIPELVWQAVGHLNYYERFSCQATDQTNAVHAGRNTCSTVEEWAEFHTKEDAQKWIELWKTQIKEWSK